MKLTYGTVCSGIEAPSVAWDPLGWEPVWFSEIEKFPCEVLKHHYPQVPNLGNMNHLPLMISLGEIARPDVFIGGTPCQSFSVAGLKKGLADARGGLTLKYVQILNELDKEREKHGEPKTIAIWENVPGVLSSKDNAFGCFLAAIAGEDEAFDAPTKKNGQAQRWPSAGYITGSQRSVAWRVLDAQYFGVAQRRRRVFVVASARDGFNPGLALFESEGMRRDSPPSREKRENAAATASDGTRVSHNSGGELIAFASHGVEAEVASTLLMRGGGFDLDTENTIVHKRLVEAQGFASSSIGGYREGTGTLRAAGGDAGGGSEILAVTFDRQSASEYGENDVSSTVSRRDFKSASDLVVLPINTMTIMGRPSDDKNPRMGFGVGSETDPSPTLTKAHSHAVAYAIAGNIIGRKPENGGNGEGWHEEVSYTLTKTDQHGVCVPTQCFNPDQPQMWRVYNPDAVAPALQAGERRGNAIYQRTGVRRLSPVECERLQGFPDNHTNIPLKVVEDTGPGPCAKQTVIATVVAKDGTHFKATNYCNTPQESCPRGDMPTGQGYELCKSVCNQRAHAEVNAIALAGSKAQGATLFVEGHTYACESCIEAARSAGIARLVIGKPYGGASSSNRYKAIGNSMAVPVIRWIGKRIEKELNRPQDDGDDL